MGKADADSAKATGGAAPKKAAVDSAKAAPTPPPKKATKAGRDGIAAFRALYCATSPPKKAPAPPKMKGVPGRADADAEVVAKVATPMKAAGGTKRKALAPADHEKAINIPLYLYDIPIYLDTYIPIYLYAIYTYDTEGCGCQNRRRGEELYYGCCEGCCSSFCRSTIIGGRPGHASLPASAGGAGRVGEH